MFQKNGKHFYSFNWLLENKFVYLSIRKQIMIPKSEMKEGWYNGFCRNNHMAYWDGEKFQYIRYKFGFYLDTIEHFEDVKEKRLDGFVPVKRIERIPIEQQWKVKDQIEY